MTLEVFSRDIVPILQFIVTMAGLAAIFLLWWQIRQTNVWNRLNSFQAFLDVSRTYNIDKELYAQLRKIEIDPHALLSDKDVAKIYTDDAAYLAVNAVLNDADSLCAAIRIGAVDPDGAYAIHSARVIRMYENYIKFIEESRLRYSDDEIFIEMEKIALAWKKQHLQTKEVKKQKVQRLKADLHAGEGVRKKT